MVQFLLNFETIQTPVTLNQLNFLQSLYEQALEDVGSYSGSPPTCRYPRGTSRKSKTGPLLTRSSSGSIGSGEPLRTASFIPLEVCSVDRQVGQHASTKHSRSIQTFHTCAEASPAERVALHDWDANWVRIPLGTSNGKLRLRRQNGNR